MCDLILAVRGTIFDTRYQTNVCLLISPLRILIPHQAQTLGKLGRRLDANRIDIRHYSGSSHLRHLATPRSYVPPRGRLDRPVCLDRPGVNLAVPMYRLHRLGQGRGPGDRPEEVPAHRRQLPADSVALGMLGGLVFDGMCRAGAGRAVGKKGDAGVCSHARGAQGQGRFARARVALMYVSKRHGDSLLHTEGRGARTRGPSPATVPEPRWQIAQKDSPPCQAFKLESGRPITLSFRPSTARSASSASGRSPA